MNPNEKKEYQLSDDELDNVSGGNGTINGNFIIDVKVYSYQCPRCKELSNEKGICPHCNVERVPA